MLAAPGATSAGTSPTISPATWGLLIAINPILVTFFQLRVTRWTAGVAAGPKLFAAMLVMGLPFLVLTADATIPVLAAVIVVFVIGEMLWFRTAQAIVARLAPEDGRSPPPWASRPRSPARRRRRSPSGPGGAAARRGRGRFRGVSAAATGTVARGCTTTP